MCERTQHFTGAEFKRDALGDAHLGFSLKTKNTIVSLYMNIFAFQNGQENLLKNLISFF